MLSSISAFQWLRLAGALLLFLGPGLAVTSLLTDRSRLTRSQTVALATGLSFSLWPVFLAWLQLAGIRLSTAAVVIVFAAGWLLYLLRTQPWNKLQGTIYLKRALPAVLTWVVVSLSAIINVYVLRDQLVGPGSDSLQHAMITNMFQLSGGIPSNYLPFVPLVTFRYHFAFHACAYALMEFSGLESHVLTPILGQLLVPMGGLTAAYFVTRTWKKPWGGFFAATFYSLAGVFPAYLINWGRYTQSAGMMLLPLLLFEFERSRDPDRTKRDILVAVLLGAGLALTHFRIAIMALIAGITYVIALSIERDAVLHLVKVRIFRRYFTMAIASLVAITPWLWHLWRSSDLGYPPQFKVLESSFFSLQRLGQPVFDYPTNTLLFVLLAASVAWMLWRRERSGMILFAWGALLVLISYLQLGSHYLDLVTIVISLFLPGSILLGWFMGNITGILQSKARSLVWLPVVVAAAIGIRGASDISLIVDPWNKTLYPADLRAIQWAQSHIRENAVFAVNSLEFPFLRGFVVGIDAGYWLPVLGHREAATYPLVYSLENLSMPDYVERIHNYTQQQADLASPHGLSALESLGATHIFIGVKGGPIEIDPLLASARFELLYSQNGASIFALQPSAGSK
jgi:hypothetical protein